MSQTQLERTILFLAANPLTTPALALREEREAIEGALMRKPHSLRLVARDGVTDDELRRALLDHEPEIVHFSGHGAGRAGLMFEKELTEAGVLPSLSEEATAPLCVPGAALADLFRLCSGFVKCVLLNACYSE